MRLSVSVLFLLTLGCSSRPSSPDGARLAAVMEELHGDASIHRDLGKLLKQQPVKWAEAGPLAQQDVRVAEEVPVLKPSKGSPESWAELSKPYAEAAETLATLVEAHERIDALEAWNRLNRTCEKCHDRHR